MEIGRSAIEVAGETDMPSATAESGDRFARLNSETAATKCSILIT